MAKAYKCDRCDGFFEPRSHMEEEYRICNDKFLPIDICPLCQAKFEAWFHAAKEMEEEEDE